jgi:hypothetical protein
MAIAQISVEASMARIRIGAFYRAAPQAMARRRTPVQ